MASETHRATSYRTCLACYTNLGIQIVASACNKVSVKATPYLGRLGGRRTYDIAEKVVGGQDPTMWGLIMVVTPVANIGVHKQQLCEALTMCVASSNSPSCFVALFVSGGTSLRFSRHFLEGIWALATWLLAYFGVSRKRARSAPAQARMMLRVRRYEI